MTIPEIRAALHVLANALTDPNQAAWLHYLADETRRRPAQRRAPAQHFNRITRKQVLTFFAAHPYADYMACATALGSTIGRVSEKIAGKRV